MDEYYSLKKRQDTESIKPPHILVGAYCCPIRRLRYPVDKRTITKNAGLIRDYEDLSFAQPIISTYWTASGELSGIGTRWYKDGTLTTLGSKDLFDIPQPAEFRTRHNAKLSGSDSSSPKETQFNLAKPKTTNVSWPPLGSETRLTTEVPSSFFVMERFLWKNELPPDHLHLTYACVEGEECDRWLIEPLIFGTTDDELSNIISIAADVQLGGFETVYKDGTRRTIGPRRHAMKHLSIDGPGGERITHLYIALGPRPTWKPTGLRFLTNRGRQLVIGRYGPVSKRAPLPENRQWRRCCAGHGLAGIFGHWSEASQGLDLVGGFCAPLPGVQEHEVSTRSRRFYWDPAPPQRRFREASMAYRYGVKYIDESSILRTFPDKATTISWLDCEGDLNSIRATFRQDTKASQFPLVSLSLTFMATVLGGEQVHAGAR
ncbi:F-box domain-containing protein [Fusarium sp. Ph1]|nr:F-box domain-containing protein [Fusarium sp. Ph1]